MSFSVADYIRRNSDDRNDYCVTPYKDSPRRSAFDFQIKAGTFDQTDLKYVLELDISKN